ncbi:hypothetical protein ACL02T_28230 [Pseudonocardia sp. RS010]|uniref:hypothetical protein n=1 Tax=Pseudonocardia sp. RS010 TaxID=3385979 RepID=UPI00399FF5B5
MTDAPATVVRAMVLGPEFGPDVADIGLLERVVANLRECEASAVVVADLDRLGRTRRVPTGLPAREPL